MNFMNRYPTGAARLAGHGPQCKRHWAQSRPQVQLKDHKGCNREISGGIRGSYFCGASNSIFDLFGALKDSYRLTTHYSPYSPLGGTGWGMWEGKYGLCSPVFVHPTHPTWPTSHRKYQMANFHHMHLLWHGRGRLKKRPKSRIVLLL